MSNSTMFTPMLTSNSTMPSAFSHYNSTSTEPIALRLVGGVYFSLAFVGFVLYLPCLHVMRTHEQLKRHTCYRMMRHLGYADVLSLIAQMSSGFVLLFEYQSNVPYLANSIVGAVAQGLCWNPSVWFIHLIAINRCLQMTRPTMAEKLFGKRTVQGYTNGLSNYLIAFVWINSFIIFIFWASPYGNLVMSEETGYAWYYDYDDPKNNLMTILAHYEMYFAHISFTMCALWYIGMILGMRRIANDASSNAHQLKREREIVLQAFLICGGSLICAIYWEIAPFFGGRYTYVICNIMWISTVVLNPIIYLFFNRTVRRSVLAMLKGEYSHGSITVVSAVNTPSINARRAQSMHNNGVSANTLLLSQYYPARHRQRSVSHQYVGESGTTLSTAITKTSTITLAVLQYDNNNDVSPVTSRNQLCVV